ncbi:hypothetical protein L917_01702 [Phytophthora nicotianae]|uniref:Uncharacterized protein n=1 Tax=Phytophthora nicotianae TaxID=4792 RepID=W2LW76_PHYNI|nr:hypothetical protein L917_01702 [Phytophthora nicotianae]
MVFQGTTARCVLRCSRFPHEHQGCHGRTFQWSLCCAVHVALGIFAVDYSLDRAIASSVYAMAVRRLFSSCSSCCCVLAFLARSAWLHDSPVLPRRALCGVVMASSLTPQWDAI